MKCSVCKRREALAKTRCEMCYRYWKRTGKDRPQHLIDRQRRLTNDRVHQPQQSVLRKLRRVAEILDG